MLFRSAELLRGLFDSDTFMWKEEVVMLCLNRANKVLGYYKVSTGGASSTIIDPRVVYTTALKCSACNIILAHNHPSGNTSPSEDDIRMTKKLFMAGELLDIVLLDHIILTDKSHFSMKEEGKM